MSRSCDARPAVALLGARIAAAAIALARLSRAVTTAATDPIGRADLVRRCLAPNAPGCEPAEADPSISVVIPARDEADRIGPLLDLVVGAPGVSEVIVVDDQSTDDTAELAARLGARVVTGEPLPDGWAGKAWALQQGLARRRRPTGSSPSMPTPGPTRGSPRRWSTGRAPIGWTCSRSPGGSSARRHRAGGCTPRC